MYVVIYSTIYPIWGEYLIQCVCVCVCFQSFMSDDRPTEFKFGGDIGLHDTHVSILRKVHNDNFHGQNASDT